MDSIQESVRMVSTDDDKGLFLQWLTGQKGELWKHDAYNDKREKLASTW